MPVFGQENSCVIPAQNTNAEQISYNLKYKWGFVWLNAGKVTFQASEINEYGVDYIDLTATGKTYDAYNWIFEVDDVFQARVKASSFKPVWFKRNLSEGKYRHIETDVYRNDSIQHFNELKPYRSATLAYQDCSRDLLSLVYYIRELPIDTFSNSKQPLFFSMHLQKEYYDIAVSYKKADVIEVDGTDYPVDILTVSLVEGDYFKEDGNMLLYVTQDEHKVPIRIESPLRVGKIQAEIIRKNN